MDKNVLEAIKLTPSVIEYLPLSIRLQAYKAAPISRDELERRTERSIQKIDRKYLAILEASGGFLPATYWQDYEAELRQAIASPMRTQIEQSFSNYSDYIDFIDKSGAISDIDTAMTRAIDEVARGVSANSRAQYEALINQGISHDEVVERMALRFSSGHSQQVAITELTRAEGHFSDALSSRLNEQGVDTQIRWETSEDERVCPICNPLDHKLRQEGGWPTKSGMMIERPPAHPNCRCKTVVEITRRKPNG